MVDSGTYTPEAIARRLQIAQQLLDTSRTPPIRHWTEGLNELLKGYTGGEMFGRAENAEARQQEQSRNAIFSSLGLPTPPATTPAYKSPIERIAGLFQGGGQPSETAGTPSLPSAPASSPLPPSPPPNVSAIPRIASTLLPSQGGGNVNPHSDPIWDQSRVPSAPTQPGEFGKRVVDGNILSDPSTIIPGMPQATGGVPTSPIPPAMPPTMPRASPLGIVPPGSPAASTTPAAVASPVGIENLSLQTRLAIATALSDRDPANRAEGMKMLNAAMAQAKPKFGFQVLGDQMFRTSDAGAFEPVATVPTKQEAKIIEGPGGQKIMSYDPVKGIATPAAQGAGNMPDAAGLTGEDFLAYIRKTEGEGVANEIKAAAEGRAPITPRNLQKLMPYVTQYDPNFDTINYNARNKQYQNYTSGKQYQEIQAINTVAGHLDNLKESASKLENFSGLGPLNWVFNQALGSWRLASQDPRLDKFNTDVQAVSNELGKAYRGGHVTEGDVKNWEAKLSATKTPEQLKTIIGEYNDLLMSKRETLNEGYRATMGPKVPMPNAFKVESDRVEKTFNRVNSWAKGLPEEKTPGSGASPITPNAVQSQRVIGGKTYIQRDGKWFER